MGTTLGTNKEQFREQVSENLVKKNSETKNKVKIGLIKMYNHLPARTTKDEWLYMIYPKNYY